MPFDMERFDDGNIEIDLSNNEVNMKSHCKGKKGFLKQMKKLKEGM
ncbi:hypothetical protein LCGC14_1988340 [marine sediment metagenome]|uniref:Uncharacterized protein n=1 Tax=marine sediment metagenome TaxID=412755 RepID=A0A0F9FUV8_9ZZZZ